MMREAFSVGDVVRIGVMGACDSELATVTKIDEDFNITQVSDHIHGTIINDYFSVYELVEKKNSRFIDPFGLPDQEENDGK